MRTVNIGTVSSPAANTLLYNFLHTIGGNALNTDEGAAALRSFNKYSRLARERMRWPEGTKTKQIIPDVRVRSISVTAGGSSYTSAPTVSFSGGGGSGATATATIDADGAVNGVAVTAEGTGYTDVPTVSFSGGSGSGAAATATIRAYIDYGSTVGDVGTVGELLRVTDVDPFGSVVPKEIPFRPLYESSSDFGVAMLEGRASTAPVWCTYRFAEDVYVETGSETGNQKGAMPYVWSEYVVMGAYGDWLRAAEQHDKARVILAEAEQMLLMEIDKLERQAGVQQHTEYTSHHITSN
jgi:hypothetical protein